jgi:hypothetical protein
MARKVMLSILLICILSCSIVAQDQTGQRGQRRMPVGREGQGPTRPPAGNERGLRELAAEELWPDRRIHVAHRSGLECR